MSEPIKLESPDFIGKFNAVIEPTTAVFDGPVKFNGPVTFKEIHISAKPSDTVIQREAAKPSNLINEYIENVKKLQDQYINNRLISDTSFGISPQTTQQSKQNTDMFDSFVYVMGMVFIVLLLCLAGFLVTEFVIKVFNYEKRIEALEGKKSE